MSANTETESTAGRGRAKVTMVFAVIILTPCVVGFGFKFIELVRTLQSDSTEGAFAITPILNYLLASIGFLCLLVWATANGMFRNVEKPKHEMLKIERQLDRHP